MPRSEADTVVRPPFLLEERDMGKKPYVFETDSGALIYVGKNNLQNENLTLKFAPESVSKT